jgi:DNA-binding CsgD family transcriptional regulator
VRWPGPILEALDAAAATARAGGPGVLAVEGEAGFGKSTLLRAALGRLDGFSVLRAYGEESAQDDRFQLLHDWGALPPGEPTPRHLLQATRLLAQVVDPLLARGPVALVLDDLQWIDPESVDTVAALVQRAAGDRLLVLAAHRPLGRRHPAWRRSVTDLVRLDGLDDEAAAALVAAHDPTAPADLARQLRAHTSGNPLHIRALLQEHSVPELTALAARGELPAPVDLAAALHTRVTTFAPGAARLLHTLAVLGDAWTDLPTAAAVGGIDDVDGAVVVLREAGLVVIDRTSALARARISHAVIRAAVYELIPTPVRRRLHRAAAARVTDAGARLRHRLAAIPGPDDGLADDLERHADQLHQRALFREATRFRRLAASVTAGGAARRRRELDADFEAVLAHDQGPHDDGDGHGVDGADPDAASSAQRRVVAAMRLTAAKQWVQAAAVLDPLGPADLAALDPLNAYRARVLRGWTAIGAGRPAGEALVPLQEAADSAVQDPALRALFTFAYGQAVQTTTAPGRDLWGFHDAMSTDRATLAASPDGRIRLAWRGSAYALTGSTTKAVDDLTVVTDQINDGTMDLGDGAFHALLGFAQWTGGHWRRASITIGLARSAPRDVPHPLVAATVPLAAIASGADLDTPLADSRDARLAGPLPSVLHAGDIADVAALAFAGTAARRRDWLARRTADFGDPRTQAGGVVPHLWLLAMGIAAAWAGDPDGTDGWADELANRTGGAWRTGAIDWLRALARSARGTPVADHLGATARDGLPDLLSFEALLWVDAANAAARDGHPGAAETRTRAERALLALGAAPYASALLPAADHGPAADDPLAPLSDREREVAALLLDGLSYAQIAKELFVTRSTVAFHLSNAYAKTGTSTRHELVRLVRPTQRAG